MRQVLASVVVSALVLLAGCGGGGDDAFTEEEAQQAVERAMLSAADLGPGWQETGTAPPTEDEGTKITDCLSEEVAAASDEPLAESDTHEFTRGDNPQQQQQVQVSTVVLEDDLSGRLVDELATDEVRRCLSDAFRKELGGGEETSGVQVTIGDFTAEAGFADAGDGATHLRAPVELSADDLTLPATVDLIVLHTGQLATVIVGFALGEPLAEEDLEAWTQRAADLQAEQSR